MWQEINEFWGYFNYNIVKVLKFDFKKPEERGVALLVTFEKQRKQKLKQIHWQGVSVSSPRQIEKATGIPAASIMVAARRKANLCLFRSPNSFQEMVLLLFQNLYVRFF